MKKALTLLLFILPTLGYSQDYGYTNFTSFSSLIGTQDDKQTYVSSIQMEHNYQLSENFSFGIITGLEWFEVKLIPFGPNIKIMKHNKFNGSYYIGGSVGYAIPLEDIKLKYIETKDTEGGRFISFDTGYIFPSKNKVHFYAGMGYRYQNLSTKYTDWWFGDIKRSFEYNRFFVKVGIKLF